MSDERLRTARAQDLPAILRLNQAHQLQTSSLDEGALARLVGGAFLALAADAGQAGFLIALDQDFDYASPNFLYFRKIFDRFVYVDRIVIAASHRGTGLAAACYRALYDAASRAGHTIICCEVNTDPPNPQSSAFHARQGFREHARATLPNGKRVAYLTRVVQAGG